MIALEPAVPTGPLEHKWASFQAEARLVAPSNRRKRHVIVVGSGLAGSAAAATLGELGYRVTCFCYQDSPRRAHSIAAQGGINAAKNYRNDGDSVERLFFDTLRGGDFRSREASVYRLAELSTQVIDQAVAQGVPFARDYGGLLANRSFGGVQVERTFYARTQTGQQLLLGAYAALLRQVRAGRVEMLPRREMLDLVVVDGRVAGIVVRKLETGRLETYAADAVVMASGGYGTIYYLSTLALGCNATAVWRAYVRGACFANPSFTQIHPTCIPPHGGHQSKLTLMSESLRNDGRIWVPQRSGDGRPPHEISESERDYYLERLYPAYGNLAPRDISSRAAKWVCDEGRGVGPEGLGVYLDFSDALARDGREAIAARYGNLFDMYRTITGDDPYRTPMRIYPAAHFTMGGLWVDYRLMTTIPGLFAIGECNFADHGANRLGANSLLQACVDGYFIVPLTLGDYLGSDAATGSPSTSDSAFVAARDGVVERIERIMQAQGSTSTRAFHRRLGLALWNACGMTRCEPDLDRALETIRELRQSFFHDVRVPGRADAMNPELERALRVADFLELGELMCHDARARRESCGAHYRTEFTTAQGEPLRNDQDFGHVSAWAYDGPDRPPVHHAEPLVFEAVQPGHRSYR